jgi:hypothetical protein
VELLEGALYLSAMVVALVAGIYAGLGLKAPQPLDRKAELYYAGVLWLVVLSGAWVGGNLGTGMVLAGLVISILWSLLHFPQIQTLETHVPRMAPLALMVTLVLTTGMLGVAMALA